MESFRIGIAGFVFQVQPMFETTREYCRKYLSDLQPSFYLDISKGDLIHEQEYLNMEAHEEGLKLRKFTDPFLERAVIQRKVAELLLVHDIILMHGSTVGIDGSAYLFTAACGTGKSTHTRLWREVFGDRAVMVNDDKPFLEISANGVIAHGSPWSGKHGLDTNISLPLKGICILRRGPENRIQRIEPDAAIQMLRHQSHLPGGSREQSRVFGLVDELVSRVPLWEMECTKEHEAARIAHAAMSTI